MSAVLAGWLMGLLVWLVAAARDTITQLFVVWLCTFIIGFGGLHHSIAGTVEVLFGVFAGQGATWGEFGRFILWSVVGNALGGVVFVGILKFAFVQQSHR